MSRRRKGFGRELLVFLALVLMFTFFLPLISGCNFECMRERVAPVVIDPVIEPADEAAVDTGELTDLPLLTK